MEQPLISFACGFAYGTTSVVVGQPLDTIKTRMQALAHKGIRPSTVGVVRELVVREGLRGFYRGSLPMLLGGSLFRSAQFGVYGNVLQVCIPAGGWVRGGRRAGRGLLE